MSRFDMQSYHSPLMSGTVTLEERGLLPDPVKYPLQKNNPCLTSVSASTSLCVLSLSFSAPPLLMLHTEGDTSSQRGNGR